MLTICEVDDTIHLGVKYVKIKLTELQAMRKIK